MTTLHEVRHVSVSIDRPPNEVYAFASKPGATAIASTAPVRGSSTTALPPLAFHRVTVRRRTLSALAWIRWSIVRKTSSPARSGFVAITSMTRPAGSRTVVWLPGLPTNSNNFLYPGTGPSSFRVRGGLGDVLGSGFTLDTTPYNDIGDANGIFRVSPLFEMPG